MMSNEIDECPDDIFMDNGDDMLDDILNTLLEDPVQFEVKTEPIGLTSSSHTSRRAGNSSSAPSKKRKINPDAEKIAEVTEAALRSLEIDPNSQDAKKHRRQIRNRLSAQFHRDRKNAYIKELEDKNAAHLVCIDSLQKRVEELEKENLTLKEQLGYYHSTLRSGSTTSASDSDYSNGASPLHQPTYYTPSTTTTTTGSLNTFREIVPNRNTSIPLPMAKTLSLLSVLCILCMTYLEHPLKPAPTSMESGLVTAPPPSSSRRRLEAPEAPIETKFLFPDNTVNDSSSVFYSNQYLRGSLPMDVNATNPKVVYVSKDLIPFDLPFQYQNDWINRRGAFDALSYSHITMKTGVALFDPAMKFQRHHGPVGHYDDSQMAVVPAMKAFHQEIPRLGYDRQGMVLDINESKESEEEMAEETEYHEETPMEEKHWPAVTTPPAVQNTFLSDHYPHSLHNPRVVDCSSCDDTMVLAKLLEQSNLVTVTVPATSVRMGKSIQESEDGTVEGIMEMFNLTSEYGEKNQSFPSSSTSSSIQPNALADASVEINCIILSAKLIVNNPKH